jgi:predicted TIM-barrel fold metal-dependent hydrolase
MATRRPTPLPRPTSSSRRRWIRKHDLDARRGLFLPVPTQVVSNEEFHPPGQSPAQREVEARLLALADRESHRLGITRREFLTSSGGMAAAFIAMNAVFGRFFAVEAAELTEPAATAERWPKPGFIFDVQTHHVATGREVAFPPLLLYRDAGAAWGNTALKGRKHAWPDLYLANYMKEVFIDSDTTMAVLSGLPSRTDAENLLPPAEMVETRSEVNGIARSRRLIVHGLFSPDLGAANLDAMADQVTKLKVEAWKGYPGQPLDPTGRGWWMDDEKVAYPAYEASRKHGIRTICVHKGLPLPEWDVEHSSPRDVPKAAADFPDMRFLIYHAAFKSVKEAMPAVAAAAAADSAAGRNAGLAAPPPIPWVSDLCAARRANPAMTNVYMELGTTFGMTVITQPLLCAHLLGMMLAAFGPDHILWGTDAIWWGSPQWQIEAFRRFEIPIELSERYGYPQLTPEIKEKIFGLNAARIYGVDPAATLQAIPGDYLSKLKARHRSESTARSNTQYGWVRE